MRREILFIDTSTMAEAAHPHIESEDNDLHIQRYHDRPLSRPRISSRNRKARDITSDFILAASSMCDHFKRLMVFD